MIAAEIIPEVKLAWSGPGRATKALASLIEFANPSEPHLLNTVSICGPQKTAPTIALVSQIAEASSPLEHAPENEQVEVKPDGIPIQTVAAMTMLPPRRGLDYDNCNPNEARIFVTGARSAESMRSRPYGLGQVCRGLAPSEADGVDRDFALTVRTAARVVED